MLHATHPAVYLLTGGYALLLVLGLVLRRERRNLREDRQCLRDMLDTAFQVLAKEKKAAVARWVKAELAVEAMAEFITASFADAPVRDCIRDELRRLAFDEPEAFRPALDAGQHPDRQKWHAMPEMPFPLDQYEALQGWNVPALRDRARLLNNAGVLPNGTVSGTEISNLNKRELIALLLRYDPQSTTLAAAV